MLCLIFQEVLLIWKNFYSKPVSSFLHNHVVQVWHVGVQEELDELKIKKMEVKRQVC